MKQSRDLAERQRTEARRVVYTTTGSPRARADAAWAIAGARLATARADEERKAREWALIEARLNELADASTDEPRPTPKSIFDCR